MARHKEILDFSLVLNEVHIWLFQLDDSDWEGYLSEEEAKRSKEYKFELDRQRFSKRRVILRQLLSRYCGLPLWDIVYYANEHGKLSMPSGRVSFSLSSSQDRVAYAFVLDQDIGVDLEQTRPLPELSQLVGRWFSPYEQTSFFALPADIRKEAFFHVWTQKEAFIKARGDGLSFPLRDFSVCVDPNQPARLLSTKDVPEERSVWKMENMVLENGWRVAVCVRMDVEPVVRWCIPDLTDFFGHINSF